jgi:hypothetical protein
MNHEPAKSPTPAHPAHAPLWPAMLRAAGLGLRPERVLAMVLAVLLVSGLIRIPIPWESGTSLRGLWLDTPRLAWPSETPNAADAWAFARSHVWASLAVGLPAFLVFVIALAVVARMTAVEFAGGTFLRLRGSAAFVIARLPSLVAAYAIPLVLAVVLTLAVAAVGVATLSWPVGDILGSLAYGLAVFACLALALVLAALLFGWALLAPAVVCEGTGTGPVGHGDGIDALQRGVAYVLNAPLRTGLYFGLAAAQAFAVGWVGHVVAAAAVAWARGSATWWLSPERAAALTTSTPGTSGTAGVAGSVMNFWEWLPGILASACATSVFAAGATLAYLLLRRVCDGQHEHEIWMPSASPVTRDENPAATKPAEGDGDDA